MATQSFLSYKRHIWIWDFFFAHFVRAILNVDPPLTAIRAAQIPLINERGLLLRQALDWCCCCFGRHRPSPCLPYHLVVGVLKCGPQHPLT